MHRFLADSRHALPAGQVVGLEFAIPLYALVTSLRASETCTLDSWAVERCCSQSCRAKAPLRAAAVVSMAWTSWPGMPSRLARSCPTWQRDTRRSDHERQSGCESDMRSASEPLREKSSVRGLYKFTCGNAPDMAPTASACSPLLWQRSAPPFVPDEAGVSAPLCTPWRRHFTTSEQTMPQRLRSARPPVNTQHRTPHSIASSPSGRSDRGTVCMTSIRGDR